MRTTRFGLVVLLVVASDAAAQAPEEQAQEQTAATAACGFQKNSLYFTDQSSTLVARLENPPSTRVV